MRRMLIYKHMNFLCVKGTKIKKFQALATSSKLEEVF
jgi:hypothetical protein